MLISSRIHQRAWSLLRGPTSFRPRRWRPCATPKETWNRTDSRRDFALAARRRQHVTVEDSSSTAVSSPALTRPAALARTLPVVCPGCGAFSQTIDAAAPGFYSPEKPSRPSSKKEDEEMIFQNAMARLSDQPSTSIPSPPSPTIIEPPPICSRCHSLLHHSAGRSIAHPSMSSLRSIIEDSPHRHNHIYHVIDAADFPMSLIPNLISALHLPQLRTQNRRSKSTSYMRDRVADVSFIITRADLLAPKKVIVDRLVPYLQEVLRDALGRVGRNLRLGNVRCVSAKRGWWTRKVKEEIWERGGAGWVVGKANVGKSALVEVVFPKGRNDKPEVEDGLKAVRERALAIESAGRDREQVESKTGYDPFHEAEATPTAADAHKPLQDVRTQEEVESETPEFVTDDGLMDDLSLLPPAPMETAYPHMPLVSSLPGTTASPIRLPFGRGKGELIDLPGLQRSSLQTHVKPEHHASLVMKSRIVPEQQTIKPGQSLLLGGIIRITPTTDHLITLAYPFVPPGLYPHVTATPKAMAMSTGVFPDGAPYEGPLETIATDTAKQRMTSAGVFQLQWDVTKRRAGPLTDKMAGKRKVEDLPFRIYGADLLVEGCGWVEVSCQVRRQRRKAVAGDANGFLDGELVREEEEFPEVEIFTPKGKFIGIRRPMNAWVVAGPKKVAQHHKRLRPRMSISMQRRREGGARGRAVEE